MTSRNRYGTHHDCLRITADENERGKRGYLRDVMLLFAPTRLHETRRQALGTRR